MKLVTPPYKTLLALKPMHDCISGVVTTLRSSWARLQFPFLHIWIWRKLTFCRSRKADKNTVYMFMGITVRICPTALQLAGRSTRSFFKLTTADLNSVILLLDWLRYQSSVCQLFLHSLELGWIYTFSKGVRTVESALSRMRTWVADSISTSTTVALKDLFTQSVPLLSWKTFYLC